MQHMHSSFSLCLPDDVVATVGDHLDDPADRGNLRLAARGFRAVHWNRTYHRMSAAATTPSLAERVALVQRLKPRMRTLHLDVASVATIATVASAISGWILDSLVLSLAGGIDVVVDLFDVLLALPAHHKHIRSAVIEATVQTRTQTQTQTQTQTSSSDAAAAAAAATAATAAMASGWRLNLVVYASAWSTAALRPLIERGVVEHMSVVHDRREDRLPDELPDDLEAVAAQRIGRFGVTVVNAAAVIRPWERRLAHSLMDVCGMYHCVGWLQMLSSTAWSPTRRLEQVVLGAPPAFEPAVVEALSNLMSVTGASLVVDPAAAANAVIVPFVRLLVVKGGGGGNGRMRVVFRAYGRSSSSSSSSRVCSIIDSDLACIAAHHIAHGPGGAVSAVVDVSSVDVRASSRRVLAAAPPEVLAAWGHLLVL